MNGNSEYKVVARVGSQMRVDRHGIHRTQGGAFLGESVYQWPDQPVYNALDQMKEEYPGAVLEIVWADPGNPRGQN